MRKRVLLSAGGAMMIALAVTSGAAANGGDRAPVEFAFGGATNRFAEVGGPNRLDVAAYRRADGTVVGYARGSGTLAPGASFQVEGEVTCVRVEPKLEGGGLRASIKYRYRRSTGSAAPPQGGGVEVFIEDNGRPVRGRPVDGNGTGPPMDPITFEASNPSSCDDPNVAGQPYNPVDSGDYTLGDGD
jgi:hypothetical protein